MADLTLKARMIEVDVDADKKAATTDGLEQSKFFKILKIILYTIT